MEYVWRGDGIVWVIGKIVGEGERMFEEGRLRDKLRIWIKWGSGSRERGKKWGR